MGLQHISELSTIMKVNADIFELQMTRLRHESMAPAELSLVQETSML